MLRPLRFPLAALPLALAAMAGLPLAIPAAESTTQVVPVTAAIDRLIVRGVWHATVILGMPRITIVGSSAALRTIVIVRHPMKLEFLQQGPVPDGTIPQLHVTLRHLRGLATSGHVLLTLADRSDVPVFLDLSQATSAQASGAVPELRLAASGSAGIDLCRFVAAVARVHARQASRVGVRASRQLVIAAADTSRVTYTGSAQTTIDRRNDATVDRSGSTRVGARAPCQAL